MACPGSVRASEQETSHLKIRGGVTTGLACSDPVKPPSKPRPKRGTGLLGREGGAVTEEPAPEHLGGVCSRGDSRGGYPSSASLLPRVHRMVAVPHLARVTPRRMAH